jgi:hypothetical protein
MSKLGGHRWIVSLPAKHAEKKNQNMRWWNDIALAYSLDGIAIQTMTIVGNTVDIETPQIPMQSLTLWMQGKS